MSIVRVRSLAVAGIVLLSLSALVVLSNCGNGGDGSTGGSGGSGGTGEEPLPSTTREIGPDGGEVSVTGLTGQKFELSVPAGATEHVTVTITALPGVKGFALSQDVVAAIRFEPEGLRFVLPATLTIKPAGGASFPANALAFLFSKGRIDPLPLTAKEGALEVPITHFSEVAIVDPTHADVGRVTTVQGGSYQKFMEWTKAFLSRDFDYFERPESPFDHWPNCGDARTVVNTAIGLCKLADFIGNIQPCNEVMGQLNAVIGTMVDGFAGANLVCGDTGDDGLILQCAAAVAPLDGTVHEVSIPQKCGAVQVAAAPDSVVLSRGGKATIAFTVLDPQSKPMAGRKAIVTLWRSDPANVVTLNISDSVPTTVTVTCNDFGSADLRAWDARAVGYGYRELYTDASVFCSYGGITITPQRAALIGNDHATLRAAVLDANGNEVPLGPGAEFVWHQPYPFVLEITPSPTNSAQVTVGRSADANLFFGSQTIQACVGEQYPCDLSAQAEVTIVRDLRGAWSGTGTLNATGCRDPEDNGTYTFNDWQASFTQTVDPRSAPVSNFSATFSGTGVGVRNWGPFTGTLSASGSMSGSASYRSGDAGGSATFQGGFDALAPGFETVILDFTYADTDGDTCSGSGRVTFKRSQPARRAR